MAFSSMPTDSDVVNLLSSLGVWTSSLTPYVSGYAESALNRFQLLTGRIPFLSETNPSSSFFDPPGAYSRAYNYPWRGGNRILELDGGFTSITGVYLGHSIDNNPGNSLDMDRQLRLMPINYAAKNVPIEYIEFYFNVWGAPNSIMVVGKRGYSSTVPGDVWTAILQEATAQFASNLALYLGGGTTGIDEADVSMKFPNNGDILGPQIDRWHDNFKAVASRYTLIRLGV